MENISVVALSSTGEGTVHGETSGTGNPNVTVTYLKPLLGILIKGLKAFLGSLFGGGGLTSLVTVHDLNAMFTDKTFAFALGAAIFTMGVATISYLTELEKKFPIVGA